MYSNVTFINIDDDNNVSLGQQRYDNGGNDCLSRDGGPDKTIFNDRRSPPHKLFACRKSIFARTLNAATRDQLWARLIKLFDSVPLPPNTPLRILFSTGSSDQGKKKLEIYDSERSIDGLMGLSLDFRFSPPFFFFRRTIKLETMNSDEEK